MKRNISMLFVVLGLLTMTSCRPKQDSIAPHSQLSTLHSSCPEALIAYAERYPLAEPQDLYKLVFQDLYGPGHLLTDSTACAMYIERELGEMQGESAMPMYEYTLCDSNFVRVDLRLVADGTICVGCLTSAVMRSAEGMPTPDRRFVLSHSAAFREAYHPHYRIVRRDIFENEILPLIKTDQQ